MLEASIELAPDPAELRTARRFVDETLMDWGLESICDDARLITGELSANAVVHACTDFRVRLRSAGLNLRIEVRDGKARMSSPAAPRQAGTSGRGLVLVSGLAMSWGTQVVDDGKVVLVELLTRGSAGSQGPDPVHLAPEGRWDPTPGLGSSNGGVGSGGVGFGQSRIPG